MGSIESLPSAKATSMNARLEMPRSAAGGCVACYEDSGDMMRYVRWKAEVVLRDASYYLLVTEESSAPVSP